MKQLLLIFLCLHFAGNALIAQYIDLSSSRPQQAILSIYRKPTKKEQELLNVEREDQAKFANFLKQPNTGLTKLLQDKNCSDNTKVVVVNDDCLAYTMPGSGNSFSFRTREYRISRLADIIYTDDSFQATGARLHGIFVNIGNVPLESTSAATNGMKFLIDFKPEIDLEKAKEIDAKLSEGILDSGFLYRRGLKAKDETTFVLRSIAYRGEYYRSFAGITYNEFMFDKRADIVVAFRIVRRHPDGAVSILWKELSRTQSPKLEIDEDDKPTRLN